MKRLWAILGVSWGLGVCAVSAEEPSCWYVYPMVQHFEWKEPALRVRESGWIYGLGLKKRADFSHQIFLLLGGEIFAGEVEYDGTRMDFSPFESKTLYVGGQADVSAGLNLLGQGPYALNPFLGLGGRWWKRRLDNTDEQKFGYDEHWLSLYGQAGLEGRARFHPEGEVFASAALLFPLYNHETVFLRTSKDSSSFTLSPGRKMSPRVEVGADFRKYRLVLFYERLEFSSSDVNDSGFYQPDSTAEKIGIQCGVLL